MSWSYCLSGVVARGLRGSRGHRGEKASTKERKGWDRGRGGSVGRVTGGYGKDEVGQEVRQPKERSGRKKKRRQKKEKRIGRPGGWVRGA